MPTIKKIEKAPGLCSPAPVSGMSLQDQILQRVVDTVMRFYKSQRREQFAELQDCAERCGTTWDTLLLELRSGFHDEAGKPWCSIHEVDLIADRVVIGSYATTPIDEFLPLVLLWAAYDEFAAQDKQRRARGEERDPWECEAAQRLLRVQAKDGDKAGPFFQIQEQVAALCLAPRICWEVCAQALRGYGLLRQG